MKHTQGDHEAMRQTVESLFRDIASGFSQARVRTDLPDRPGAEGMLVPA
jgi:hypothetical protein